MASRRTSLLRLLLPQVCWWRWLCWPACYLLVAPRGSIRSLHCSTSSRVVISQTPQHRHLSGLGYARGCDDATTVHLAYGVTAHLVVSGVLGTGACCGANTELEDLARSQRRIRGVPPDRRNRAYKRD